MDKYKNYQKVIGNNFLDKINKSIANNLFSQIIIRNKVVHLHKNNI